MSKALYLKIIGIVELVVSSIGIIFFLVYVIGITAEASWAVANFGPDGVTGFVIALCWVLFFVYAFFAPSIGILFLTVASHEDSGAGRVVVRSSSSISTNYSSKISELQNRVNTLERKVIALQQSSTTKGEPKSEDPLADFSEEDKERLKKQMLEEMIDKKEVKVEPVDKPVVTGKDKDDYALDERVVFNQDFSTNGIDIKKGDTGIIDNRLLSSGGRIYVVILDKTKDTVKVSGVYFE